VGRQCVVIHYTNLLIFSKHACTTGALKYFLIYFCCCGGCFAGHFFQKKKKSPAAAVFFGFYRDVPVIFSRKGKDLAGSRDLVKLVIPTVAEAAGPLRV